MKNKLKLKQFVKKPVVGLMVIVVFSKILGFFREIVMSYYYGASYVTDTFALANSSANIFFGWVAVLAVLHTPFFQEIKEQKGTENAQKFTNQLILLTVFIGGICLFVLTIFSNNAIGLVAKGFSAEMVEITSIFFRWAIMGLLITTINQIWISELNCKKAFISANATNLILSLIQVIIIFTSGYLNNIMLLKVSQPLAVFIQLILLIILVRKNGRTFKLGTPFVGEFKRLFILITPVFFVTLMDQINTLIDRMFASGLTEGSISALNYAHMVKQLFFFVFATAIVTILFPKLSESISQNNLEEFKNITIKGIRYMIILFVPITLFVMTFSNAIVSIIYERGAFDSTAAKMTSESLFMYGSALLPLAIREILLKGFLAMMNTRVNLFIGILSTIINIALNFLLVSHFQHMGLALSTSLTAYLTVPILFFMMRKKIFIRNIRNEILLMVKTLFSALVGILIIRLIYNTTQIIFSSSTIWSFTGIIIGSIMGVLCYILLLKIMKVDEMKLIIR